MPKKNTQKAAAKPAAVSLKDLMKISSELKALKHQRAFRLETYVAGKDSKLDVTALDAAITTQNGALAAARSTLASMYGNKAVPYRLPISINLSTTGGAGVLSAPLSVDASTSPEFSALAALFDEYRVCSGVLEYMVCGAAGALTTSGATTFSPDSMLGIGYDPADNTAATSVRNVTELKQHRLVAPVIRYAGAAGSYSGVFEGLHRFKFNVTPVAMLNGILTGQWKPTSGTSIDGYIKPYCQTLHGTLNGSFVVGILYLKVEFRSRT